VVVSELCLSLLDRLGSLGAIIDRKRSKRNIRSICSEPTADTAHALTVKNSATNKRRGADTLVNLHEPHRLLGARNTRILGSCDPVHSPAREALVCWITFSPLDKEQLWEKRRSTNRIAPAAAKKGNIITPDRAADLDRARNSLMRGRTFSDSSADLIREAREERTAQH